MTATATAALEIVSFPIEGMTCASCVNRITRFLSKVEGVAEANVNLASESATVTYDTARLALADLVAAVDAAGYVARVEQAARRMSRKRPRPGPSATRPPPGTSPTFAVG